MLNLVFSEQRIITAQPTQHIKTDCRPPPSIATSPFGDPRFPGASTFTPRTGLDFLHGIPSIHVEQTVSLLSGMKNIIEFFLLLHYLCFQNISSPINNN